MIRELFRHGYRWPPWAVVTTFVLVAILAFNGVCAHASPAGSSDAVQISVGTGNTAPLSLSGSEPASEDPVMSPDGVVMVLSSKAINLVPGFNAEESSLSSNVFYKLLGNFPSAPLELASVSILNGYPKKVGLPTSGQNLEYGCVNPSVSRAILNGNTLHSYAIVFASDARDIVPEYNTSVIGLNPKQVYLRLPVTNKTVLLSGQYDLSTENSSTRIGGNKHSDQPTVALLSGGVNETTRFRVAFRSSATDIYREVGNYNNVVYWRDVQVSASGEISLDRLERTVPSTASVSMSRPALSADGSRLAVAGTGAILAGRTSSVSQVYVFDVEKRDFRLISRTDPSDPNSPSSYNPAQYPSLHPSLSWNGSEIGFLHEAPANPPGTDLTGITGGVRSMMVKCNVPELQNDSVSCLQVNTNIEGTPSSGSTKAGRLEANGRYAAFSDTGSNLLVSANSGEIPAQVYLKQLHADSNEQKPLYLTSKKDGEEGKSLPSGETNGLTGLESRPPVAVALNQQGEVYVAFSSWANNLGTVGTPSMYAPYVFASEYREPTATPTVTPTATPTATDTPTSTATPLPTYTSPPGESSEPPGGSAPLPEPTPSPAPGVLPTIDLRDGGSIEVPPFVEVIRDSGSKFASVVIVMPEVRIDPRLFEKLKRSAVGVLAAKGIRIKYEVEIRKAGSKQRITRSSSRNVVTVRKLAPGSYTIRYRVTATKGQKTVRSRPSAPTSITIS